jgi:CPA2 family monovalent cation:H+ antiporter-2
VFFPGDTVYLFGKPGEVHKAEGLFQLPPGEALTVTPAEHTFDVEQVFLTPNCEIVDQTLASARLRQNYGITVLGIQRGEHQITRITPDEILNPGDLLYVIGDKQAIQRLQKTAEAMTKAPFTQNPGPQKAGA